jgi:hypothetical protein
MINLCHHISEAKIFLSFFTSFYNLSKKNRKFKMKVYSLVVRIALVTAIALKPEVAVPTCRYLEKLDRNILAGIYGSSEKMLLIQRQDITMMAGIMS